ncbi:predicted NUDIX hydrolase [gamma proteobacterium HdN1]|nr:predicted NUDIX hydrolase [gamma proteobacterium HdN1]
MQKALQIFSDAHHIIAHYSAIRENYCSRSTLTMSDPIPSSTVVLLRDTRRGIKVLLLRRNSKIAYGGSWVFPGGRIDPDEIAKTDHNALQAAKLAAVRETHEEAGITLEQEKLVYFSHWTTPVIRPKRFSTWFFMAPVSEKKVEIDGGEIHDFEWHTPESALQAQNQGSIELPPPTFVTLTQLSRFGSTTQALEHFAAQPPLEIQPIVTLNNEGIIYLYNGDGGYASANPEEPGRRHRLLQPKQGAWTYICEP